MRHTLRLSASALALLCCGAANAQTTPAGSGSAASGAPGGGIETVVVTADRRTTDLQKTAIAATVLSGDDLAKDGVLTVDQLQFIAPSVTVDNFGQGIDFDIRGIGKAEHNSQTSPGVITYRDGVATFPGYFTEEPYFDIANVQILRGPQGTFAGQNAIGGAVLVNSNNPVIDGGYDGYVLASAGNYSNFGFQGAVNLPVSDTVAARIAFFGDARDSFYSFTGPGGTKYNGNPGDVRWGAVRFSLLWQPNSRLSVLFKTDADYLDSGAYPADPYTDRFRFLPLGSNTPNPNYTDLFHLSANSEQLAVDQFVRTSLKVDYTFADGIKLQSISAYQRGTTAYTADLDGNSTGNQIFSDAVDEAIYSQEVDLISPDTGRFNWVLGAYAQSDEYVFPAPYRFIIGVPPGSLASEYLLQGHNPTTDLAAFGQANIKLPAGFEVQLGGRYTATSSKNSNLEVLQYGLYLKESQKVKAYNFSYKADLNWNVDDNNFLYAFVATGFKPGGLNVPVGLGAPAPFSPEKLTDYEAGWKSTFLDGHLRTQIDGYYNDYRNFQVIVGYPAFPTFGFELNDPKPSEIYGFEAETQAVFGALSFDAGVGLMQSSLGTFYASDPRVASVTSCNPATGPASASCINLSGHKQTYAPNFTFNVSAQYEFKLDGGDSLTPRVNYGHESQQWATLLENPALGDRLTERNILGAQLAWVHGTYITTLYGTNLTDQHYVAALNSGLDFAGPPRQFGISVTKLF